MKLLNYLNYSLIILCVFFFSCGESILPRNPLKSVLEIPRSSDSFFSQSQLNIEIAYEEGAEPYVGEYSLSRPPRTIPDNWEIVQKNLAKLFEGRAVANSLAIPKKLEDMKKTGVQNKSSWTSDEILDFAEAHTQYKRVRGLPGFIFFVFLKGHF